MLVCSFFTVGPNFTFFAISSELFVSQKSIWYQNTGNLNARPMAFIFWKYFQSVKSYKETRFWYEVSKIQGGGQKKNSSLIFF